MKNPISGPVARFSGLELQRILDTHQLQFVWGVLSGFRPGRIPDVSALDPYPIAEELSTLWSANAKVQRPDAEIEIVCFDSSFTSLRTCRPELGNRFARYFPGTIDLDSPMSRLRQRWE